MVGEIVDEHDIEASAVERLADGDMIVPGGMPISDLDDLLALHLPDEEWDTVGGFLFGTLEHVPVRGESIVFQPFGVLRNALRLRVCGLRCTRSA